MVVLTVHGRIAGKGSRTVGLRKDGSRFTRPASKFEKPWVKAVADAALWRKAQGGVLEPPYAVYLDFYFAPKKRSKWGWPSQLDLDKALRATTDGLVDGGLIVDDRHITEYVVRKFWAASEDGECCKIAIGGPERRTVQAA